MNIRTFISFVEMFGPEERPNTAREISTVFPAIETSHISGNPDKEEQRNKRLSGLFCKDNRLFLKIYSVGVFTPIWSGWSRCKSLVSINLLQVESLLTSLKLKYWTQKLLWVVLNLNNRFLSQHLFYPLLYNHSLLHWYLRWVLILTRRL